MSSTRERIRAAQTAEGEDLWRAIKGQHPEALENATLNRHLTEDMALYIAKNKNTPSETLGFLAGDVRFREVYRVRLAVAKNPRCPQRVALSLIKYLRLFDLADITRDKRLPSVFRQKVELTISEKLPALPPGVKTALAKRACAGLVVRLMEIGDARLVDSCLESPVLTEDHLRRVIQMPRTRPAVIRSITRSPKWSLRYPIKYALVRNFHTPTEKVERFAAELRTPDLQDLYNDPKVPASSKPFIHAELKKRKQPSEPEEERVYELRGDEDEHLP
ncbi:MAG: hypothetical protein PVJ36_05790 [Nitrospirota bacterium]|jgi:hypothetical protein